VGSLGKGSISDDAGRSDNEVSKRGTAGSHPADCFGVVKPSLESLCKD
jgi:hypothetical protein